MKKEYQYKTTGNCRAESVVQGKDWRFTVLTPALIRMEYNADGIFENRATQVVVNRDFDTPEFTVIEKDGSITIKTECLELTKIVYLLFWEAKTVHHFSRGISVWMRTILKEQRVLWTVQTEHALWRTE